MSVVRGSSFAIKICHVAHGDLWAGAETQLNTLLDAFLRIPGFECSAVLLSEGRLAVALRKLGIAVTVIDERTNGSVATLRQLVKHFRALHPDIIHTHKYKDNILGCIAGRMTGVPRVVRIVHGVMEPFSGLEYFKTIVFGCLDWVINRYAVDRLIAVSGNLYENLIQRYGEYKVIRIHNGVDLDSVKTIQERGDVKERLGVAPEEFLVGTVGRLTAVKGQDTLLRAIRGLLDEGHRVKCVLIGDGPLREFLHELAQKLGIEKDIVLAGEQHAVYDFLNAMDVFVLPSLHEGIPMVLLEALAIGRPVIASRVGGIPEVVEDGRHGLLIEPEDVNGLRSCIVKLMKDRALAESLGSAGRTRVGEEFSAAVMALKTAQVYRDVLGRRSSGREE